MAARTKAQRDFYTRNRSRLLKEQHDRYMANRIAILADRKLKYRAKSKRHSNRVQGDS